MKTETQYGIFYKSRGKWIGPYLGELITKEGIIWESGLEDVGEYTYSFDGHCEMYLRQVRKRIKKPVILGVRRIIWETVRGSLF
jgi:hypothetical protein